MTFFADYCEIQFGEIQTLYTNVVDKCKHDLRLQLKMRKTIRKNSVVRQIGNIFIYLIRILLFLHCKILHLK